MLVAVCLVLTLAVAAQGDEPQAVRFGNPAQGLVGALNGLVGSQGGHFPGHGNNFPGQGGVFPGQGGVFPGQGGLFPGQGGNYPGQGGSRCRYWCRTPERQYYCCDQGNNPGSFPITNPGICPPVRDSCPPVRFGVNRPVVCAHDGQCHSRSDKCCFDRCLGEHVCKPASNYFG